MFSAEDIQELLRLLPPEEILQTDHHAHAKRPPPLLRSPSGNGLLTQTQVSEDFKRAVSEASHRMPIALLAEGLDVELQVVLQLVQDNPALALLSGNKSDIVPKSESCSIIDSLHKLVDTHVLSKTSFAQNNDVSLESIDHFIQAWVEEDVVSETDGHILSKNLEKALKESISNHLEEARKESVSVELSPSNLLGEPPVWLITRQLEQMLEIGNPLLDLFYIDKSTSTVHCILKELIVRKVNDEVGRLASGETPYLDLKQFAKDHHWYFASWTDARDHLSPHPVQLHDSIAVSQIWISNIINENLHTLMTIGCVDMTSPVGATLPSACQIAIIDEVEEHLIQAYEQKMTSPDSSHSLALYRVGDFLITPALHTAECAFLLQEVKKHASSEWNNDQEKEPKFQMSDFVTRIPKERSLARTICLENKHGIASSLEGDFTSQITDLETETDYKFTLFWVDRVLSRVPCYVEGLNAVEDQKLRDQLSDLLSAYVSKELLPDIITKSRSSGFARGKKTRKNIQKLESTIKSTPTVQELSISIDKFSKKQGIPEADSAGLAHSKESLVEDMVRKMQKYSDGPLLFLTLVIILRAKHRPGVVYATGKFAPKLLKLLKSTLSAGQYETLEKYKDQAKAGSLRAQDKEDMKKMAAACKGNEEEHV
ncbi:hypothetical protein P154DRAFT_444678 [Amniculicola lignicola CBS 123094]|uniref:Uncharacterized protein n=1 Tax=Amniculicola lignicola CBS 123094 TaxID=1392246 RepID=A0A6A5W4E7_9PLEO|nr:hypothetical protein P154DRAFT_444678 [Amniculicola lignicola CBS 123094]